MAGAKFSLDLAKRVVRATQLVEELLIPDGETPVPSTGSGATGWVFTFFKATSTTATSGLYPCSEATIDDPEAQSFTDGTAGEAWAYFPNGETPTLNDYYCGVLASRRSADDKPIFISVAGIGGGAADTWADSETPSGTINGVNAAFTLANNPNPDASLRLYKNGIRQRSGAGNDYTLSGTTITFESGNIPQTNDILLCDYRY